MPYLTDSEEWRLLNGLGRLLAQRRPQYRSGLLNNHKQLHHKAATLEGELRRAFSAGEIYRELNTVEFEDAQAKLRSLCLLLERLAPDQTNNDDLQGQNYPRLRALEIRLASMEGVVDLIDGPNEKVFRLPDGDNNLSDCLDIVTEYNVTLSKLLVLPTLERTTRAREPRDEETKWKKVRIRNHARSILNALFENFKCDKAHEVLLKLMGDPNEKSVLSDIQLMLSKCTELELWQGARSHCDECNEALSLSIQDICAHLQMHSSQGRELVLYARSNGLFGSWRSSNSPEMNLSSKEALDQLIKKGAFESRSHDINRLLDDDPRAEFNIEEKRALALKLGFCLMDFFDAGLKSTNIYFPGSSLSKEDKGSPYLSFSSRVPTTPSTNGSRTGDPTLLSFAKLLLEIDCGQIINIEISPENRENYKTLGILFSLLDKLEGETSDSYLQAIRGCLTVHAKIAKALKSNSKREDADLKIREGLYKKIVHKLKLGLEESAPRSSRKRERSVSPRPNDYDEAPAPNPENTAEPLHNRARKRQYHRNALFKTDLQRSSFTGTELVVGRSNGFFQTTDCNNGPTVQPQPDIEAAPISPRPKSRREFEVAIVCALPLEFDAVSLLVDEFWSKDGDYNPYGRASGDQNTYMTGRVGRFNVVLTLMSNMGKVSAASSAASLRSSFPTLRLVLLTGICGGVPNPGTINELLLGDVVLSKAIIQYDHGRLYPNGFVMKDDIEDVPSRLTKDVRNLVRSFETHLARERLEQRAASLLQELQQQASNNPRRDSYQYPGTENDRLHEADRHHKHHYTPLQCRCANSHEGSTPVCDESRTSSCDDLGCNIVPVVQRKRIKTKQTLELEGRNIEAQAPSVFVGRIGSGDLVLKSGEDRDRIAKQHGILAFEMEGAGVWDEMPCLVVKGVCDYADSHKNKDWQAFAAATAASVTKAILEQYPQTENGV